MHSLDRIPRLVLLGLLALAACGPAMLPVDVSSLVVVGRLELAAPERHEFVLHGTLPVPRGAWTGGPSQVPLFLRSGTGALTLAQVEIVSRHPVDADGADVIELISRVQRDPTLVPGVRIQYDVMRAPLAAMKAGAVIDGATPTEEPIALTPPVQTLLAQNDAIVVRSWDVFGNSYAMALDLPAAFGGTGPLPQAVKILRFGPMAVQARLAGPMLPEVPGPVAGTFLPHFPMVHAYVTAWKGETTVSLDLRISNGSSGHDKTSPLDDPLGKIYFDRIEVALPGGWQLRSQISDPLLGSPHATSKGGLAWPIVDELSENRLHVMPAQAQFHRRLVVGWENAPGDIDESAAEHFLHERGLAFCQAGVNGEGDPLWSWWNGETANYFPQRKRLPALDHIGKSAVDGVLQTDYDELENLIETGNGDAFPVIAKNLGWAHPWGVGYGGMAGGGWIVMWEGVDTAWSGSNAGYRQLQLLHRMNTDRQANVLYDLDGRPTTLSEWIVQGPQYDYVPMFFYMKLLSDPDPFGYDQAPTFQQDAVAQLGLQPTYEDELLGFEPHDLQHLVRYTRSAKALAWLGNDMLAKDDLQMQAELVRLSYHHLHSSQYDHVIVTGLLSDQLQVAANPHDGFDFGRGEGWGLDTMCAAYSLGNPSWRATARPWFEMVADVLADGQAWCTGIVQRMVYEKVLDGKFGARQSIEQAIVENAIAGLLGSVLEKADPTRASVQKGVLAKSTGSMLVFPAWSDNKKGPWSQLAVGPLEGELPSFCGFLPYDGTSDDVDSYQCWASFAYGYELTKSPIFLVRAQEMISGPLLPKLEQTGLENLGNQAGLLALMQEF